MQLTTFLSITFSVVGLAVATPTDWYGNDNLAFLSKRGECDCEGIKNCCYECYKNGAIEGEACCNNDCQKKFPNCYAACD